VTRKAYIDVRGDFPILVSGLWAYSLEYMILAKSIPKDEWRDICVSEAMEYVVEIGYIRNQEAKDDRS
jgi:hypothetical protein